MIVDDKHPRISPITDMVWYNMNQNYPHYVKREMTPGELKFATTWLSERNIKYIRKIDNKSLRKLADTTKVTFRFYDERDALLFNLSV